MNQRAFDSISLLSREELEGIARRAAVHLYANRTELQRGSMFMAILTGFLLGALVAAAGFMAGSSLG